MGLPQNSRMPSTMAEKVNQGLSPLTPLTKKLTSQK
jgi:hypothetical protein